MNVRAHNGKLYEVNSHYSLPDDAWRYELTGLSGAPGTRPYLIVLIPDATPADGPFTPRHAEDVQVLIHDGQTPWPVLHRFVDLIEDSGDVTHGPEASQDIGTLTSSNSRWQFADRRFEANSFHFGCGTCSNTQGQRLHREGDPDGRGGASPVPRDRSR
jgi:hypothetical protein